MNQKNCSTAPFFTVFTPVYNRAATLSRPFNSLSQQTYKNFEWVIIDDGSTDDSWNMIQLIQAKASFPITAYRMVKNQGKHIAWNRGVELAKGLLFVPLDSDDECVPETLETFTAIWESINDDQRELFSGINVLCKDPQTGNIIGNRFPQTPIDSNNLELTYRYKIRGEKWGCIRTEVLRRYQFSENYPGGYLPESYLWFQIAQIYKTRCVNIPLRLYYKDQPNQITRRKLKIGNSFKSKNTLFYLTWHINTNINWLLLSKKHLLSVGANLVRTGFHQSVPLNHLLRNITNHKAKPWLPFFVLLGLAKYTIDIIHDITTA